MEPLRSQRRHQVGAHAQSVQAPGEEPAHLHALIAAAAAGHKADLPVSAVTSLQRSIGNTAVTRMLTGQAGSGTSPPVVQRAKVSDDEEMLPSLGGDLVRKHVGTEPMPDVSSPDGREQAASAVYYQRADYERKDKNTVFFVQPDTLFTDLKNNNMNKDLDGGSIYTTASDYDAITVLVAGQKYQDPSGKEIQGAVTGPYKRLVIEYGPAKPLVKVNKVPKVKEEGTAEGEEGRTERKVWAFNHLQLTEPSMLGNKVDLLKSED